MNLLNKIISLEKDLIDLIYLTETSGQNKLITYLNQNCINQYYNDCKYRKLIDENFNVYNDGIGSYIALKVLGKRNVNLINATDLNERILKIIQSELKIKPYLIGGYLYNEFKLRCNLFCGYSDGYSAMENIQELIQKLKREKPLVIFIGMGVPKQEKIAYEISKNLENIIIICVGNFFEYYFKRVKRIPKILRNTGLEWLFRLYVEPRRLWRRYLIGIPIFVYKILKYKLR